MRRLLLVASGCLCALAVARADPPTYTIRAEEHHFFDDNPDDQVWLHAYMRYDARLSSRTRFVLAPLLTADSHHDVSRSDFYDDRDRALERSTLLFQDLKLRFDLSRWRLDIGKQRILWGRTDGIRPTDMLTPYDWTDPLNEIRLARWAARFRYEKSNWNADFALIPGHAPSRLPELNGRWLRPGPSTVENPGFPRLGPPLLSLDFEDGESEFPESGLNNYQYGARFGRRGSRFEWTVSYFYGFDDAPHVDTNLGSPNFDGGFVPVALDRRYPELQAYGVDGLIVAGSWIVRYEAAYSEFEKNVADDFWLYVVEAEWARGNWRSIFGFAGFAGSNPTDGLREAFNRAADSSLSSVPENPVIVGLDYAAAPALLVHVSRDEPTEWNASFEVLYGTSEDDYLFRFDSSWPIGDSFRSGFSFDVIGGPAESFFGQWNRNDRIKVFVQMMK